MAERPEIDPRFDPIFQRGYVSSDRTPAVPQVSGTRPPELVGLPPVVDVPRPEKLQPEKLHAITPDDYSADAVGPQPRGINPYIVSLWIIGVVLAVGGTALLFVGFLGLFTGFSGSSERNQNLQFLYILGNTFAAPLITVGLATIAGLIFISAWKSWHRRGGPAS